MSGVGQVIAQQTSLFSKQNKHIQWPAYLTAALLVLLLSLDLSCAEEGSHRVWKLRLHQYLPANSSGGSCTILWGQSCAARPYECWSSGLLHAVPAVPHLCLSGSSIPLCSMLRFLDSTLKSSVVQKSCAHRDCTRSVTDPLAPVLMKHLS